MGTRRARVIRRRARHVTSRGDERDSHVPASRRMMTMSATCKTATAMTMSRAVDKPRGRGRRRRRGRRARCDAGRWCDSVDGRRCARARRGAGYRTRVNRRRADDAAEDGSGEAGDNSAIDQV